MKTWKRPILAAAVSLAVCTIASAQDAGISPEAAEQIRQLILEKQNRTPAQRKLNSNLVYAVKANRLEPLGVGVDTLPGTSEEVKVETDGRVKVEVFGIISSSLQGAITAAGGQILHTSLAGGAYTARLPLASLEGLAGRGDVSRIDVSASPVTNSRWRSSVVEQRPSFERRAERVRAQLGEIIEAMSMPRAPRPALAQVAALGLPRLGMVYQFTGLTTSQGIVSHGARTAHLAGYTGNGIRVGVLSDSALPARVAALQASGNLPPGGRTVVLPGQAGPTGGSDEGTAMMEIIYDMAPGVDLYFATAFTSFTSFADNIRALRDAGCQVIVDDVTYFAEGVFQDDLVAQAVNDVTASGVVFLSSAGNSGTTTVGTGGTWEGDFVDGGAPPALLTGGGVALHRFPNNTTFNVLTLAGGPILLKWADPLGGSCNDYDLYRLNSTGTQVLAASTGFQTCTQDPVEGVSAGSANHRLVIVKFIGADRALHLSTNRGRLQQATTGTTYGHNAGENTLSMAAVFWNAARRGARLFTGGPTNPNEPFSSQGPRRIFFRPDGTPITPGNFLFATNGGQVLIKPDIAAADGVATATPGFQPFFGTSAAAPHAAAIAAIIKGARPSLTVQQIKTVMRSTALDNMAPGVDSDSGYGITMTMPALNAALALP